LAFRTLAGGAAAHIVVIPTASVDDTGPPGMNSFLVRRNKERFGVGAVTVLHALDRATSDSNRFVDVLRAATGIWILGGFPPRLVHSYLGTKTERAIREMLDRGGVVGGESAGAMIQASWLDTTDDEFTPDIRALIKAYGRGGFGLLTNVAVFPHFNKRGTEAAVRFRANNQGQVGIGIDEETALIVKAERFQVIGQGTVSIYDGRRQSANPIVLRSSDHYDLATRK
jgi:cyanophycinase